MFRKGARRRFGQARMSERLAGDAGRSVKARPEPVDDGDRHEPGDVAPALPTVEASQIVSAHDPDEPHLRAAPVQITYRLIGVARADPRFEIGDVDARIF